MRSMRLSRCGVGWLLALAGLLAVAAPAAAATSGGGCTQLYRFFYVRSANLTETITAHWNYDDNNGYTATLDTTQTGTMAFRGGLPSRADRKKYLQYSQFIEPQGSCRIPDYRQGWLTAYEPVDYNVNGQWTAGQQSGTCSSRQTERRLLHAEYIRRSLDWHFPTVGFRWMLAGPPPPGCTFTAYSAQDDQYVTRRLHNAYGFGYTPPAHDLTFTKKLLLNAKTVTLPVNFHAKRKTAGSTAMFDLKGTVVLQRYKACTVRTLQDILHGHCYDASYP